VDLLEQNKNPVANYITIYLLKLYICPGVFWVVRFNTSQWENFGVEHFVQKDGIGWFPMSMPADIFKVRFCKKNVGMDFVNVPLLINALPYNVHREHWPVVSSVFNMFQHILIQFFLVENFGKFLLISLKFQNKSTLTLPNNEKNLLCSLPSFFVSKPHLFH
jgi:hypothetical protein